MLLDLLTGRLSVWVNGQSQTQLLRSSELDDLSAHMDTDNTSPIFSEARHS